MEKEEEPAAKNRQFFFQIRNVDRYNWIIFIRKLLPDAELPELIVRRRLFPIALASVLTARESSRNMYPKILIYLRERRSRNISSCLISLTRGANANETRCWRRMGDAVGCLYRL